MEFQRLVLDVIQHFKRILAFPRKTFFESEQSGILFPLIVEHEVKNESQ